MAVELSGDNIGFVLTYDSALVQGETIDVRAINPDDPDDPSTRSGLKNDGVFVWTYPMGYSGITEFTVIGSEGGEDSGTVEVNA